MLFNVRPHRTVKGKSHTCQYLDTTASLSKTHIHQPRPLLEHCQRVAHIFKGAIHIVLGSSANVLEQNSVLNPDWWNDSTERACMRCLGVWGGSPVNRSPIQAIHSKMIRPHDCLDCLDCLRPIIGYLLHISPAGRSAQSTYSNRRASWPINFVSSLQSLVRDHEKNKKIKILLYQKVLVLIYAVKHLNGQPSLRRLMQYCTACLPACLYVYRYPLKDEQTYSVHIWE